MEITKASFDLINKMISGEPPETGGIVGSKDDHCITDVVLDKPNCSPERYCRYEPDVDYLNECIADWTDKGIYFKGIFHTHFAGVISLSDADTRYINKIMRAMPAQIEYLYFPVFVFPQRELICYKAEKTGTKINITYEDTIVR